MIGRGDKCREQTGSQPCVEGCCKRKGIATEGGQEVSNPGKVHRKRIGQKVLPTETKVSHVICLGLILFNTCGTSQNQLTLSTEVPL